MENVFIAGHKGMVGSAICRRLLVSDEKNISLLTEDRAALDLTNQNQVNQFFETNCIDTVILAAAKVGGIRANVTYPADFLYENLLIQSNVIHAARTNKVKKLLFLGSSCIYPKHAKNPITETSLLTDVLEPTNEAYAIAKISGIKLCASINKQFNSDVKYDYRSVMPTNLYGPGDNYHPLNSHVVPGLLRRFHNAKINGEKQVKVWGSGTPKREFLHVDDLADACIFLNDIDKELLLKNLNNDLPLINIGSGKEITIKNLANLIRDIVGFNGDLIFDTSQPDGTPKKLICNRTLTRLGWAPKINLQDGLERTYQCFLNEQPTERLN